MRSILDLTPDELVSVACPICRAVVGQVCLGTDRHYPILDKTHVLRVRLVALTIGGWSWP